MSQTDGQEMFRRAATAIVDGVEISGLHIEFKVTKSLKKEPNTLDLSITNLAQATRSSLQKKGASVILLAGYVGSVAQLFSGDARTIDHVRKGADWITRVQCGDGERNYVYSRTSESFGPGTSLMTCARRVASQLMGRDCGQQFADLEASGFIPTVQQFAHGYVAHGRAAGAFDTLMQAAGLDWSVQDGQLQLLPKGKAAAARAIVLSPDSGLIGSPEHGSPDQKQKTPVLKVRSLLQPALRCGGVVELQSLAVKGQFRVDKLTHTGDTDNGSWFSDLECKPLAAAGVSI